MAKNKNRKQASQQDRSAQSEKASQGARSAAQETQSAVQSISQGSPADVARKHQRRFGHN